jgi:hypothetical protein
VGSSGLIGFAVGRVFARSAIAPLREHWIIDARGLCAIGRLHGEKLLAKYRFGCEPERFALQRLQTVRKALRSSLTNLKKSYQSLLELSFPELGELLEVDGVGIRQLLAEAPTPEAIAQKRLSTLE